MLKTFVEEAAALASLTLFVGMIAVWAQLIPSSEVAIGQAAGAGRKAGTLGPVWRFGVDSRGPRHHH